MLGGISRWTVMQIEHSVPRRHDPAQRDVYSNCFYACERCNKLRGTLPNQNNRGNTLLDPCQAIWAEHFELLRDYLRPYPGDGDAEYTWESYGLDDPVKVGLRKKRRQWIEDHADAVLDTFELEPELLDRVVEDSEGGDTTGLLDRLNGSQGLRKARRLLLDNLSKFKPIPKDYDTSCRCSDRAHLSLPKILAEQTVTLRDLLRQARERRDQDDQAAAAFGNSRKKFSPVR